MNKCAEFKPYATIDTSKLMNNINNYFFNLNKIYIKFSNYAFNSSTGEMKAAPFNSEIRNSQKPSTWLVFTNYPKPYTMAVRS